MEGSFFPSAAAAGADGVVGVSRRVTVEMLLEAYSSGIFPWPVEEGLIPWVSPDPRAVLDFANFRVPKSCRRELRAANFATTVNGDFAAVIAACAAAPRRGEGGTWITSGMVAAYNSLHRLGRAISVETRDGGDGTLVGGLYGVLMGRYFAGESMFHRRSAASKAALVHLVGHLAGMGLTWIDVQMTTPLLSSFGATEITRGEFLERLRRAL